MITQYAFTGIYVQNGSEWMIGTPMDFPEAFDRAEWELFQPTDGDRQTAQKLVEDSSPDGAVVIVKIFPTHQAREEWFRSARTDGLVG